MFLIIYRVLLYLKTVTFQISVPMSVEFDELAKARENPTEEMASKYLLWQRLQSQAILFELDDQPSI